MKQVSNREGRDLFEKQYGDRISDATWYRLRKTFDKEFPMTPQNIAWLADIKKQIPQLNFRFLSVIQAVKQSQALLNNRSNVSGDEILDLFEDNDLKVHANTLTKWFKPIHGFSRKRIYQSKELLPVVLAAFSYKLRKEANHSFQITHINK